MRCRGFMRGARSIDPNDLPLTPESVRNFYYYVRLASFLHDLALFDKVVSSPRHRVKTISARRSDDFGALI